MQPEPTRGMKTTLHGITRIDNHVLYLFPSTKTDSFATIDIQSGDNCFTLYSRSADNLAELGEMICNTARALRDTQNPEQAEAGYPDPREENREMLRWLDDHE